MRKQIPVARVTPAIHCKHGIFHAVTRITDGDLWPGIGTDVIGVCFNIIRCKAGGILPFGSMCLLNHRNAPYAVGGFCLTNPVSGISSECKVMDILCMEL